MESSEVTDTLTSVELGVRKEFDKMAAVFGSDEVAWYYQCVVPYRDTNRFTLQMSCNISKGFWISIYEQSPYTTGAIINLLKLLDEKSREVRGCSKTFSLWSII